jgi:hypothetical protein
MRTVIWGSIDPKELNDKFLFQEKDNVINLISTETQSKIDFSGDHSWHVTFGEKKTQLVFSPTVIIGWWY